MAISPVKFGFVIIFDKWVKKVNLLELSDEDSLYFAALKKRAKFEEKSIFELIEDLGIADSDVKDPSQKFSKLKAARQKNSKKNISKKVNLLLVL